MKKSLVVTCFRLVWLFLLFMYYSCLITKKKSEQIQSSFEVINSHYLSSIFLFCVFFSITFCLYYIQNYLSSFPLNIPTLISTQELNQRSIFDRYIELNNNIIGNYNTFDNGLRNTNLFEKRERYRYKDKTGFKIFLGRVLNLRRSQKQCKCKMLNF